jgi:nucleotidyltransferase/DNA polymerase involved in DNA repair
VDAPAYHAVSKEVMAALRSFDAVVQELGWDEAFLGVETDDPEGLARDIQRRVLERTRLWCTVGIGDNRLQAKLASEAGKPRGVFRLTSDRWHEWMDARATDALWGIGTKTAQKLTALRIRTVGELAAADPQVLASAFGLRTGPWLQRLARGEDSNEVSAEPWVPKAVSREHTFQRDLIDRDEVARELDRIARDTAGDVAKDGRDAARVVVKVRFAPFTTKTRGVALERPTKDPRAIAAAAAAARARFQEEPDRPIRLLGVRAEFASGPTRTEQPPLTKDLG